MLFRLAGYLPRPVYPIPSAKSMNSERGETVRRVSARASEGNVRLSRGQIMYPARIEKLYGGLKHVDF